MVDHSTPQPADARPMRVWRPGDGPTRCRRWPRGGPHLEVRVDGQWRAARLAVREDRGGAVIVHCDVHLPDHAGPVRRTYAWDPATIRQVQDAHGAAVETYWDAEGRISERTHPPAS
jgi:hypothetical protein